MPQIRRPSAVLALLTSLLLAGSAAAEADRAPTSLEVGWKALRTGLGLRPVASPLRFAPDLTRLRSVSARAVSPVFAGVKLWASGAGYAVGRRSAGYGLQGGASLLLDIGVSLTASYRLSGFALGNRLDPQLGDVDERTGAPFLGLDFEF